MTMTTEASAAERAYEIYYREHKTATEKFRAGEIGDAEFIASANTLKAARNRHEGFLFGGTDNAVNY